MHIFEDFSFADALNELGYQDIRCWIRVSRSCRDGRCNPETLRSSLRAQRNYATPVAVELYPAIEPYDGGMLDVGDGNAIAWDIAGARNGKPAVVLHGGPGQGSSPNMRRAFDPRRYRVVLFDQRGCGRSTPHANDPAANMAVNTTEHLVGDIERLRQHLAIDRWLVAGGSWGATLALAYAERHPSHVSELVLTDITTSRRSESEWLYRGVARFFPEAWEKFSAIDDYVARMEHPDREVRLAAARAWCEWEDAVLSLEWHPPPCSDVEADAMIAFVRICAHYARHGAWLEEGALIRDAHLLAGIPGVLIHGRRDMSCPIVTAWELARAWPAAQLIALDDSGHLRSDAKRAALLSALDGFAPDDLRR